MFTRIFFAASSHAMLRASCRTPDFVEWYPTVQYIGCRGRLIAMASGLWEAGFSTATYVNCDRPANTGDHDNAPAVVEPGHLASRSLGSEKHTFEVHVDDLITSTMAGKHTV